MIDSGQSLVSFTQRIACCKCVNRQQNSVEADLTPILQSQDMYECEDPTRASSCLRKTLLALSQRLLDVEQAKKASTSDSGAAPTTGRDDGQSILAEPADRLPALWAGKFAGMLEAVGSKERRAGEVRIVREVALRASDVRRDWKRPAQDLWDLAHRRGDALKVRVRSALRELIFLSALSG